VTRPFLSIVTTLYRSEAYVEDFWTRAIAAATALTASFEVIFVDDGSPDGSAAAVRKIVARDPRAVLVELSRNFGHHKAIMAGLGESRGEYVFLLDSDLEEEPEWLLAVLRRAPGCRGGRRVRDADRASAGLPPRLAGDAYYKLFNAMANVNVPEAPARCG
jgi:putative glycosyltransferase